MSEQALGSVRFAEASAQRPARAGWIQFLSQRNFEWNRLDVPIRDLPDELDGLRIFHLTDMHMIRRWSRAYDRIIESLRDDPPDLVALTGDFVDDRVDHRRAMPCLERFLPKLSARIGIFATLGNHDGDLLGAHLERLGVRLLNGEYLKLQSPRSAAIELIGFPGVWKPTVDLDFVARIPARSSGVPRIILSHYPDEVMHLAPLHADLALAGHTHGGQICLPGGFPIITHDTLPRAMSKGVFHIHDGRTTLVVNRGLGMSSWPIRAFAPAEVIDVSFVRAA